MPFAVPKNLVANLDLNSTFTFLEETRAGCWKATDKEKSYHILARSVLQRETPAENRPRSEAFILVEHVPAVGDMSGCFFFIWLNWNGQMAWLVGNS